MTIELLREEIISELKTIYTERDLDVLIDLLLKVIVFPTDRLELSGIESRQFASLEKILLI